MKLLIEIPEKLYNFVKSGHSFDAYDMYDVSRCIANGKPFDSVLDKIKAEITNIHLTDTDGHINNWYREPQAIINDALQIIDKYKEGDKE